MNLRLMFQQADAATQGGQPRSVNPALKGAAVAPDTDWFNPTGDRGPAGEQNFEDWDGGPLREFEPGDQFRGDGADVDPTKQGNPQAAPPQVAPTVPPEQQQAQEPEPTPQPAEAATDEGQQGETAHPGRDETSPGDGKVEDEVAKILQKFQSPRDLAVGYKEIQRLATAKGEENKELQDKLAAQLQLVNEHFEADDEGNFVLKPEVAVQRLQEVSPPVQHPNVEQIRNQVIQNYRDYAINDLNMPDDEVPDFLERSRNRMNQDIQRALDHQQEQFKAHEYQQRRRAYDATAAIFTKDPSLEEVRPELEKFLSRFPKADRHLVINRGYVDLHRIGQLLKSERNLETAVREAYAAGIKAAGGQQPDAQTPTPTGARVPRAGAQQMTEDQAIKQGIMSAGSNPMIGAMAGTPGGLKSLFD